MGQKGASLTRLQGKVTLCIVAVVFAVAVLYLVWAAISQQHSIESKVLAEARTLNVEMSAVWDYIDQQQSAINYNSDGRYDFKGLYCSVAGKAIAQRFTMNSDGYVIRYARTSPRTPSDEPDGFEAAALLAFEEGASEYYGFGEVDGKQMFRYVSALTYSSGCLDCHGTPAGETDETGYPKEGAALGDLGGAVSIAIPLENYEHEAVMGMIGSVTLFIVLTIAVVIVVRHILKLWVIDPLENSNAHLREDNEAKSDFLAVMSHELRTPLSSIIAFTDIWERRIKGVSADGDGTARVSVADEERYISEIRENSRILLDMVNNTIDAEKLEQGRFPLVWDEIDLIDVVGSVCNAVSPLAQRKEITLIREIDPATPMVTSDWGALCKITMNLVGNALKFTDEGGSVTVGIRPHAPETDGSCVELSVRDTGCGIREEDLELVFGKFSQSVFRTASNSQGSGLGLFLVRNLAEMLGGYVELESKPGVGSTFRVILPINPEQAKKAPSKRQE